jgi:hypothetical protein
VNCRGLRWTSTTNTRSVAWSGCGCLQENFQPLDLRESSKASFFVSRSNYPMRIRSSFSSSLMRWRMVRQLVSMPPSQRVVT